MEQEYLRKAAVLIEALPYIQKFNRKIVVIKYGGSAMLDENLKFNVIKDAVLLKLVGFKPIIVHGGGKDISKWVERSGNVPQFVKGLRVTDLNTMEIAEMVLNRVYAAGVSGKDGGMLKVTKKMPDGEDICFVGEIQEVNPKILMDLLEKDFLPIVCPIGFDAEYNTYNINADDAACAIAAAVHAEKLAFLTDTEGLYKDFTDKNTLIRQITVADAKALIESGELTGGMLPKLTNCINAIKAGVNNVHILDGRVLHSLLLEIFTHDGVGSVIKMEGETLYGRP